jgi:hypothetical protein
VGAESTLFIRIEPAMHLDPWSVLKRRPDVSRTDQSPDHDSQEHADPEYRLRVRYDRSSCCTPFVMSGWRFSCRVWSRRILPDAFARPAAYGDLVRSLLALLAIATLKSRLGTIVVWVFNIVGTIDLLNAFYQGNRLGLGTAPRLQGAAYFIPTVLVPLLLVTHALVFRLLATDASVGQQGRHSAA